MTERASCSLEAEGRKSLNRNTHDTFRSKSDGFTLAQVQDAIKKQ